MTTVFETGKSAEEMRKQNPENFNVIVDGRSVRPPRRFVYIHSVAKRDFGPLNHALFPKLRLRGCTSGERSVLCAKIGDPIPQSSPDQERGGNRIDEHDAWAAASDLIMPRSDKEGGDYVARGIFLSLSETPSDEEIKRAENARDDRFRKLTQKAFRLEATNPRALNEYLLEEPDVHLAMDMLGLEAAWHKRNEVKATCPNCGDLIKPGIAFHQSSAGILCVIDEEKYQRMKRMSEPEKRGPGRPPKDHNEL